MAFCVLSAKIYLAVPFSEKEHAKHLGSRFDWDIKKWYILSNHPNRWRYCCC